MDPTELASLTGIGGVILGSIVTGFFGLVGPTLQSRREHRKWLRESRLSSYGDYLTSVDAWMTTATTRRVEVRFQGDEADLRALDRKISDLEDEASRVQSRVVLLGPDPVRIVAGDYMHLVLDYIDQMSAGTTMEEIAGVDTSELTSQRALLLGVMNRVLGIGPI